MRIPALRASKAAAARSIRAALFATLASFYFGQPAHAKDDGDDESAKPVPAIPNLYLDMRTNYSTVPAGALSIGFGTTAYSLTVGTPLYAVRN
jgi:hypothetical protein